MLPGRGAVLLLALWHCSLLAVLLSGASSVSLDPRLAPAWPLTTHVAPLSCRTPIAPLGLCMGQAKGLVPVRAPTFSSWVVVLPSLLVPLRLCSCCYGYYDSVPSPL